MNANVVGESSRGPTSVNHSEQPHRWNQIISFLYIETIQLQYHEILYTIYEQYIGIQGPWKSSSSPSSNCPGMWWQRQGEFYMFSDLFLHKFPIFLRLDMLKCCEMRT